MKRIITVFCSALLLLSSGTTVISAKKVKSEPEVAVYTLSPKMTCANCENKIKTNLRFEKGVKEIRTDLKSQTVTVKYDAEKTDKQKITAAFKKIGYTATESAIEEAKQ